MRSLHFIPVVFFCLLVLSSCNRRLTGQVTNNATIKTLPLKELPAAEVLARLPSSVSLRSFCPSPLDQKTNTCFAIASAYGARTILYNVKIGFHPDPTAVNDTNSFSDGFVVAEGSRLLGKKLCKSGWDIASACMLMEGIGVPKLSSFPAGCGAKIITPQMIDTAGFYKVKAFKLFEPCVTDDIKINAVKAALAAQKPVVLAFNANATSFDNLKDSLQWRPTDKERKKFQCKCNIAKHAICAVAYDDVLNGGSFLVMNSWGTAWGKGGFCWIGYKDFADFTMYAVELDEP